MLFIHIKIIIVDCQVYNIDVDDQMMYIIKQSIEVM